LTQMLPNPVMGPSATIEVGDAGGCGGYVGVSPPLLSSPLDDDPPPQALMNSVTASAASAAILRF
jgi:hypothetical protein